MKVTYKDMFPHEFDIAFAKKKIAYLPIGALEWHGYHNALGLDCLKPERILELVAQQNGGIVFPSLYLGYDLYPDLDISIKRNKAYDCYHLEPELYTQLIQAYTRRMQHIGFERVFILSGHYPNKAILEDICLQMTQEFKKCIVSVHTEIDFVADQEGDHAGKRETSLLMATHPKHVDLSLMDNKENRLMGVKGEDPMLATQKRGEKMIQSIVKNIVKYLDEYIKT